MSYATGKLKKIIYHNENNGYLVALFRIKETDEEILQDKINKTITITGLFNDVNLDINIKLFGKYARNEKFGYQYMVDNYEIIKPTTKEAIIEFLTSSFVESCGTKTAQKLVDYYGEKTLDKIKEDKENILKVGIPPLRAEKIYNSLLNYNKASDSILKLQNLGFSIDECSKIYNKFKNRINEIFDDYFYDIAEIIDFNKVDNIYQVNVSKTNSIRINACFLESFHELNFINGDTYHYKEEIQKVLSVKFNINLDDDEFDIVANDLIEMEQIIKIERRYYLKDYYIKELNIAKNLKIMDSKKVKKITKLEEKLAILEKEIGISYNDEQKKGIISSLNNNITIISGGPGTGKTTIINAIVKLYIDENKIAPLDIVEDIALLAPTGRASKRLSFSTGLPAYTIHHYLKWYKDSNDFYFNEFNRTHQRLVIVDEVSMIDTDLFNALLNGINPSAKLILVGDSFQLPSVGPGLILNDLINSDYFNFIPLKEIYRQSSNSYIPYLAKEIKNVDLSDDFINKRDDYLFIQAKSEMIKSSIEQVIGIAKKKGIDEKNMQILAPMYKGENGIDNLNYILQNIYNPRKKSKNEITYMDVIYREGDKILQLVNDLENNIFNGDIGYITEINKKGISINFEGSEVTYQKKDLIKIKHAYAITIHKSQGSEFDHVIMPVCNSYYKMLYNKLIYTGVSRAKKSLTIIGDPNSFIGAVRNNYSSTRKTSLKERIEEVYN